ncbi:hypothetical protein [Streptomyces sp. NPDC002889]|uniref:hypothetical protein n=1 Tax=Streptomyces sp. NPDC002889 TaxID=3364669 RepID=UPI0036CB896D
MTGTTTENTSAAPALVTFHWVMTVQAQTTTTLSNTAQVPSGTSRSHVYSTLRAHAARELGSSDFVVLFFALEPDRL